MASFFLAPALVQLRKEVDELFPDRDRASDGWIGDASHQARPSDHNPCWNCSGKSHGIVRAIDIDISPDGRPRKDLRRQLLKAVIGDPRVWYVISNGIIYSRTHGWVPRRYTGSNGHFQHVHVSLNGANGVDPSGNFNTNRWFPKPKPSEPKLGEKRSENFRDSRPDWDVKILDRAVKNGNRRLAQRVKEIDEAVASLPDDEKDTRVKQFKELYDEKRILRMRLLNKSVQEGRSGAVKSGRDRLRQLIKSVLR